MIVVQHVDAAEAGDSLLYHLFHRLLVAAVKIDGMRIFTDLSNDVLRAFQENVSADDLCSFAREPFGGGPPNPTPTPADHTYLFLPPTSHSYTPLLSHAHQHSPSTATPAPHSIILYPIHITYPINTF